MGEYGIAADLTPFASLHFRVNDAVIPHLCCFLLCKPKSAAGAAAKTVAATSPALVASWRLSLSPFCNSRTRLLDLACLRSSPPSINFTAGDSVQIPEMAVKDGQDTRIAKISSAIRVIPNFPKPGIMFQDITTLLLDTKAFKDTIDLFVERYRDKNISVVAGTFLERFSNKDNYGCFFWPSSRLHFLLVKRQGKPKRRRRKAAPHVPHVREPIYNLRRPKAY
ncbi:hypothetical protein K1719_011221 [Acacia pycnantha]|nr:hypothetical protein K1719_011221 [Acacia pycnantha]